VGSKVVSRQYRTEAYQATRTLYFGLNSNQEWPILGEDSRETIKEPVPEPAAVR